MKRVVVLDAQLAPDGFVQCFQEMCAEAGVDGAALECRTVEEIAEGARECDAAMCCFAPMDGALLCRLPRLKLVVRIGIGVDNLNLEDFTRHGVLVCNTPEYGIEEVAVHSLALVLALERNLVRFSLAVKQGQWSQGCGREMRRISRRTLGLLGFGRIARKLAAFASQLGYALLAFDPYVSDAQCAREGVRKVGIDELFSRSDVIVVLAPATEETRHIVNEAHLGLAKDGLLLVNTSRGSLVDTRAVLAALQCGRLQGVGLDVLETEPPDERCAELLRHEAVIVTPHVAYRSAESLQALNRMSVRTALEYLCGNTVTNLVNTAVLRAGRSA